MVNYDSQFMASGLIICRLSLGADTQHTAGLWSSGWNYVVLQVASNILERNIASESLVTTYTSTRRHSSEQHYQIFIAVSTLNLGIIPVFLFVNRPKIVNIC
jgi:hypothetical protein